MYSRSEIHDKISSKYGKHGRILLLSDTVLDKCDEWYTINAPNIKGKTNKQVHKDLSAFIMQEVNVSRGDNPYTFVPAFIWMWIAGQIISFIIQWWLNKNVF
jgi:hypothetical protein